jgi:hypothetical protein
MLLLISYPTVYISGIVSKTYNFKGGIDLFRSLKEQIPGTIKASNYIQTDHPGPPFR